MTATSMTQLLGRLTATMPAVDDAELLRRFITDHDADAFQEIVRRYGPMVFDVCQSVLRHHADSEDALQATFWQLTRVAKQIRQPAALAAWLHGTAYRTALKARTRAARRRRYEEQTLPPSELQPTDPSWAEVRQALHVAIHQLPERERQAVVLCYLHGHTQDHAGRLLGISKEGIKKRLERGRTRLRAILVQRGFGPLAVLGAAAIPFVPLATAFTQRVAWQCVQGCVPASVRVLACGGLSIMTLSKILGMVALLSVGAWALTQSEPLPAAPKLPTPKAENPPAALGDNIRADGNLVGEWVIIAMEAEGKELPDDAFNDVRVRVGKDQMHFIWPKDKKPLVGNAFLVTDPNAKPKSIDMKWQAKEHDGKISRGIYQIVDGQLKIGVRQPENAKMPRPKGYATVSGTLISITLERPRPAQ